MGASRAVAGTGPSGSGPQTAAGRARITCAGIPPQAPRQFTPIGSESPARPIMCDPAGGSLRAHPITGESAGRKPKHPGIQSFYPSNDERMHHYQRGRASIMGLMVELREIIETGRLVVVVMTRLVMP